VRFRQGRERVRSIDDAAQHGITIGGRRVLCMMLMWRVIMRCVFTFTGAPIFAELDCRVLLAGWKFLRCGALISVMQPASVFRDHVLVPRVLPQARIAACRNTRRDIPTSIRSVEVLQP
jgi:hypothetical protein